MQEIIIKNYSTVVSGPELKAAMPAFQKQTSEHFAPAWGVDAKLLFMPQDYVAAVGSWLLCLFDDADAANALGYHDITARGDPLGKVFCKTTKDDGGIWTVTFSHELLEMLADPGINLAAVDENADRLWAYEICDACEADDLGYDIDGVRVSDFVLPTFFMPSATPGVPRDWCGHVKEAFQILPGGYLSYLDFRSPKGWQQVFASAENVGRVNGKSRTPRRRIPSSQRRRSTAD